MHPGHRLYSDFFWSGLQGMADPSGALPSSHPVSTTQTPAKSRRRQSFLGIPNFLALSTSSSRSTTREDVPPHIKTQRRISSFLSRSSRDDDKEYARPHAKKHRRISSLLPNPPKKWFGGVSRPGSSLHESLESHESYNRHLGNDEVAGDKVDLWITAGGPFLLTNHVDSRTFGPFTPFPESKSLDNLDDDDDDDDDDNDNDDPRLPVLPKQGLFLPSFLQESLKRRERPSSVQTMPIISGTQSRRSSLQRWSIPVPDKSEKRDSFNFRVWRELSPLLAPENEDPVHLDWREFHANLLHNTDMECDL
ncbi:hypothetical protein AX15_004526 [Amanita polypyramis BW_CC]|nr:hypothetical protein AX15_004526 [Amanita polypyramis BW_CC]